MIKRIMNSLSTVTQDLNNLHKSYFKSNGMVTYILYLIGIVSLLAGAYLANEGIKKRRDISIQDAMNGTKAEEHAFKIGHMAVYKPEFFIPGAIIAGLGGLAMLTYSGYKFFVKPPFFQDPVHEKCERVIKDFNDKSKYLVQIQITRQKVIFEIRFISIR